MLKRTLQVMALASLAAVPVAANTTQPENEILRYKAYVGGIPLGEVRLDVERTDNLYEAKARFDMITVLRLILDTDANASVAGFVTDNGPQPVRFEYFVRDGEKTRNTEILFDTEGNASELHANPPFSKRPYNMSIEDAAGAYDPATAVLVLSAPRVEPCRFAMDVFDGKKRHRLTLLKAAKKPSDGRVTCVGRYDRIAGFRPKDMTSEKRSYPFKATLEQNSGGEWIPTRIWADTKFGAAIVRRIQ